MFSQIKELQLGKVDKQADILIYMFKNAELLKHKHMCIDGWMSGRMDGSSGEIKEVSSFLISELFIAIFLSTWGLFTV